MAGSRALAHDPRVATLAAEFPNDNPDLHAGAIWVCLDVVGPPVAEPRVVDEADAIVVEELAPLGEIAGEAVEVVEPEVPAPRESAVLPKAPDDPFTVFVAALVDVAMAAGSPLVASIVSPLLVDARLDPGLGEAAMAALAQAGVVDGGGVSAPFAATVDAWRGILRGECEDFCAVGGAMLDEWSADLLARLLAAPERAPTLKRDLRARGVAAFGLIAA